MKQQSGHVLNIIDMSFPYQAGHGFALHRSISLTGFLMGLCGYGKMFVSLYALLVDYSCRLDHVVATVANWRDVAGAVVASAARGWWPAPGRSLSGTRASRPGLRAGGCTMWLWLGACCTARPGEDRRKARSCGGRWVDCGFRSAVITTLGPWESADRTGWPRFRWSAWALGSPCLSCNFKFVTSLFVAGLVRWTPSGNKYPSFTEPSCKWKDGSLLMNVAPSSSHNTLSPAFRAPRSQVPFCKDICSTRQLPLFCYFFGTKDKVLVRKQIVGIPMLRVVITVITSYGEYDTGQLACSGELKNFLAYICNFTTGDADTLGVY